MYSENDISFFLFFGFLPDISKDAISGFLVNNNISELSYNKDLKNVDENEIIKQGVNAIKFSVNNINSEKYIVLISGGLDSRGVLGRLIELGLSDRIQAVTFGIPGTYDFEIGKLIGNKLGLNHRLIDLSQVKIKLESLIEVAKNGSSFTTLFDAYYNYLICKEYGKDYIYWSGYGGPLEGYSFPKIEPDNWDEAISYFIKANHFSRSISLIKPGLKIRDCLPKSPLISNSIINYHDQLNIALRQQNYIKRVVIFDGFNYQTPCLSENWVKFILSMPMKYRIDKYIYKKILFSAYPDLFSLPTANNYGKSIRISKNHLFFRRVMNYSRKKIEGKMPKMANLLSPIWKPFFIYKNLNYLDFDDTVRNRKDFKEIIRDCIYDLKRRNVIDWIDIESIYKNHQKKYGNYGNALLLLAALEISFKSEEQK